jgi:hypothetical protein
MHYSNLSVGEVNLGISCYETRYYNPVCAAIEQPVKGHTIDAEIEAGEVSARDGKRNVTNFPWI